MTDPDLVENGAEILVLPPDGLDNILDTVRMGAAEYPNEHYCAGMVDGAEQFHHLVIALALDQDDDK